MKKRLVVRLEAWEKAIVFQVLEQEGIELDTGILFTASNNIEIISKVEPGISAGINKIYLRGGYDDTNLYIDVTGFNTNTERDAAMYSIKQALEEYAASWRKEPKTESPGILVFEE